MKVAEFQLVGRCSALDTANVDSVVSQKVPEYPDLDFQFIFNKTTLSGGGRFR